MALSETIRKVRFTLLLTALFWVAAASGVWAQSSLSSPQVPQAADSPSTSTQSTGTVLLIGGGDLLKVSIFGAPESDQEVRVDQAERFREAVDIYGLPLCGQGVVRGPPSKIGPARRHG